MTLGVLAFTAVLFAQQAPAQGVPPRDAAVPAPQQTGAVIRGRVTAAATQQPLHRVRITLRSSGPNTPTTVTDTRGRYEFKNVPAGTYTLSAARAGYLTIQYGQRRPREAGRRFDLRNGDVLEKIDVALYRGGVISGRITDDVGEPAANVRVEAVELRYLRGRRVPVAAKIATSNDAGEYRLSGLDPGLYQVRAASTDTWESDDGKNAYSFALTYYPGVSEGERTESVSVSLGQEVSGTDIRLVSGPAARITGVILNANGEPMAGEVIALDRITRTVGGALMSAGLGATTKTDARGAFEFARLASGEYNVYTTQGDRVHVGVTVNPGDTRSVTLTPHRSTGIAGTVTTDDGGPPPFAASRLTIEPVEADPASVLPMWGATRPLPPKADWTFRLTGLDGQYLFRVSGQPDEWTIKSVTLGDRDVTDSPIAIPGGAPDVTGLQIQLTRKGATLAGDVLDPTGQAAPDATVIVFGEQATQWGVASRYIKVARPDDAGKFSIAGLLPGAYRVIAREDVADGQWEDAGFLQSLIKDAVRVELSEGAKERIKLTAGTPR